MPQLKSLIGKRFGRLTVIERAENKGKHIYYLCVCDCGNTIKVRSDKLSSGSTISCGCRKHESKIITHGKSKTKLYHVYIAMKQRCYNPNCEAYHNYGGRGIKICDEWLGENGFVNFYNWAFSNGYREGAEQGTLTIDRIDVDKGYSPDNCRWRTIQEQQMNTTRNVWLTYGNEKHTLKEWSEIRGIKYSILRNRVSKLGWPADEALEYKEHRNG